MAKFASVVICGVIALQTGFAAAGPPIELPALTQAASRLSGLAPKRRVRVVRESAAGMRAEATKLLDRDYPPDQQAYDETLYRALGLLGANEPLRPALVREAAQNVLGLYDPVTRILYVRRGRTFRRAVVHELVHALQDQTFNLRRLTSLRRGSRDAANAGAAAVEGDAVFATSRLGARKLTTDASPLALFLELEHAFPYTTGLRFVATLHNLGGNSAIFSALRTFPQTTEQIFHIDAFLTRERADAIELPPSAGGLALARTDTFGELDVRALLATFGVAGLDRVAGGWGGGRTGLYHGAAGDAVVLALAWDTPSDADEWAAAVGAYVAAAFGRSASPVTTACGASACWSAGGRSIAFARDRERTALVVGPTAAATAELARAAASKGKPRPQLHPPFRTEIAAGQRGSPNGGFTRGRFSPGPSAPIPTLGDRAFPHARERDGGLLRTAAP
jgi:hypothetical protein